MPEITVAVYIPSYVPHLIENTLTSAVEQTLDSLEIIVVDDCRTNAESRSVKSTFKKLMKSFKLRYGKSVRLISMCRSAGIPDALRSAVGDSSGKYFTVLMMGDRFSDATTLSNLLDSANSVDAADRDDWSLVQGTVVPEKKDPAVLDINPDAYDIIEKNIPETFTSENPDEFVEKYFLDEKHSLCLEGKLFLRTVLEDALLSMPRAECHVAAEYMWNYFFCRNATSFFATDMEICVKDMDSSPDSGDFKIETPGRWSRICTASSAFTAIFYDFMERPMKSDRLPEYLRAAMTRYALSNIKSMSRVDDSIKGVAEAILCEAWGDDIISQCRDWLKKNSENPEQA